MASGYDATAPIAAQDPDELELMAVGAGNGDSKPKQKVNRAWRMSPMAEASTGTNAAPRPSNESPSALRRWSGEARRGNGDRIRRGYYLPSGEFKNRY